ncbi:MAG: hypothetical protein NC548_38070 [Lachnospiraceae bacterium]|nr:hypothetical protein [Bacteroides fragilis]MCM1220306.1 hypothetical protein [Lachnospiraceae bacterium]
MGIEMISDSVSAAYSVYFGEKFIDTLDNTSLEREVGLARRKTGVLRNELSITTKLWACHGYQDMLRSIDSSLKKPEWIISICC